MSAQGGGGGGGEGARPELFVCTCIRNGDAGDERQEVRADSLRLLMLMLLMFLLLVNLDRAGKRGGREGEGEACELSSHRAQETCLRESALRTRAALD